MMTRFDVQAGQDSSILCPGSREVLATRAELEASFGPWYLGPELMEDGRSTRLGELPGGGQLYLTHCGNLLAVHATKIAERFRARLFKGGPDRMWEALQVCYPQVRIGDPALPRFRVLREVVGLAESVYGVFDLREFRTVAWSCDHRQVVAAVKAGNGPSPQS